MAEFTGERLIPGQVDADLWNEHAARYRFARQYAPGKRILDAGCGAGYGARCLAEVAASVAALDVASEAVAHARENYRAPNLNFVQGSCSVLPFASAAFDLIVNFEVIEHLHDWRACLEEFRRVLAPEGILIISTPNTTYYADARRESGPNPFHVHEFEYAEFAEALAPLFPQVDILTQNHTDGVAFLPSEPSSTASLGIERTAPDPTAANFFVAVCRLEPGPAPQPFVFLPTAANVLRERETHIRLLAADLEQLRLEKQNLVEMFRQQGAELHKSNRWAEDLDAALKDAGARISALQDELAAEQASAADHVARLESEKAAVAAAYEAEMAQLTASFAKSAEGYEAQIARDQQELAAARAELARCVALLDKAEATVVERSQWALRLQDENQHLLSVLETVKASRWVKLAGALGASPLPPER